MSEKLLPTMSSAQKYLGSLGGHDPIATIAFVSCAPSRGVHTSIPDKN